MAAKKIKIPADKLAEARFLYEQTMTPIDDIAEVMGISRGTFFNRIRELKWQPRRFIPKRDVPRVGVRGLGPTTVCTPSPASQPSAARHPLPQGEGNGAAAAPVKAATQADADNPVPPEQAAPEPLVVEYPRAPAERLALAERVQNAIERQLTAVESIIAVMGPAQPEAAETHARTLASLARTMREMMRLQAAPPDEPADDDDVPRDLDELRRELLRKMDGIIARRKDRAAGDV